MTNIKCIECGSDFLVGEKFVKYYENNINGRICDSCNVALEEIDAGYELDRYIDESFGEYA